MRIAIVHFENGAKNTLAVDFKDEDHAKEIALSSLESITGKHRDELVRVTRVEIIDQTKRKILPKGRK